MKKRITMALVMLMLMLMLCACGTDPAAVDYNGRSYTELQTEAYQNVNAVAQLAAFFEQNEITEAEMTRDLRDALSANYGFTEQQMTAALTLMEVQQEFGAIAGVDEESFQVEKAGNTLTTDITLQLEKRNVTFQVVYTYYSMEISGFTVEPIYSLSEKMAKAGMNTLISVSIVFVVLILISLIIACFNIFPYLEKKRAAKNTAVSDANAEMPRAVQPVPAVQAAPVMDDTELIAVIAAAIAASTGASTSDFVVRSINRR